MLGRGGQGHRAYEHSVHEDNPLYRVGRGWRRRRDGLTMRPFDYIVIFFSIVVSLALADIVFSLHRLLRAGGRVRWHWMAPATAWISGMAVLAQFWRFWSMFKGDTHFTFFGFMPYAIKLVLMF